MPVTDATFACRCHQTQSPYGATPQQLQLGSRKLGGRRQALLVGLFAGERMCEGVDCGTQIGFVLTTQSTLLVPAEGADFPLNLLGLKPQSLCAARRRLVAASRSYRSDAAKRRRCSGLPDVRSRSDISLVRTSRMPNQFQLRLGDLGCCRQLLGVIVITH